MSQSTALLVFLAVSVAILAGSYKLVLNRIEPKSTLGYIVLGLVILMAYVGALVCAAVTVFIKTGPHC